MRIEVDPHSARATTNSRRTIEDAGVHTLVERFGRVLVGQESGAKAYGSLQYLGTQQRPESPAPMECVRQQLPPGIEKHLPQGGERCWFFPTDPRIQECGLPILIVTHDAERREVEYYYYDRLNANIGLRPQDFEPDMLWPKR
jgi:hypothetical protein